MDKPSFEDFLLTVNKIRKSVSKLNLGTDFNNK